MKLVHFSREPVVKVRTCARADRMSSDGTGVGPKPRGFWVTDMDCEDNWLSWCRSESFGLENLAHQQEVRLSPRAKILYLRNTMDIDLFTQEHGAELHPGFGRQYINWKPICREYQGIVITPYIWQRRLDGGAFWYYGWDCASGVIWDARAIDHLACVVEIAQEGKVAA